MTIDTPVLWAPQTSAPVLASDPVSVAGRVLSARAALRRYTIAEIESAGYTIPSPSDLLDWQREQMSVPRLYARLVLVQAGLWDHVSAWASSADPANLAYFEDAQTWRRTDATLAAAAAALGLTDTQMDDLFLAAIELEASV